MNRLGIAIQWRDEVETEGPFTDVGGHLTHMQFATASQKELDAICSGANAYYEAMGSTLRIANRMGELIPADSRGWKARQLARAVLTYIHDEDASDAAVMNALAYP